MEIFVKLSMVWFGFVKLCVITFLVWVGAVLCIGIAYTYFGLDAETADYLARLIGSNLVREQ